MKIVLAVDSFKGSLSSLEINNILADKIEELRGPQDQIVKVPISDGGEGTVEALVTAGSGEYRTAEVSDTFGNIIEAVFGVINSDTAVIEMASVAGLGQLKKDKRDPLQASSRGLGELIVTVMDAGFRKIVIGIGGSATNDGGMGMLAALGARFYSADKQLYGKGEDLEEVVRIDFSNLDGRLEETDITVIQTRKSPCWYCQKLRTKECTTRVNSRRTWQGMGRYL